MLKFLCPRESFVFYLLNAVSSTHVIFCFTMRGNAFYSTVQTPVGLVVGRAYYIINHKPVNQSNVKSNMTFLGIPLIPMT